MKIRRLSGLVALLACLSCSAEGDPGGGGGDRCTTTVDCAVGERCVDARCVPATSSCTGDGDCAAGERCDGGACVPAGASCEVDDECPGGQFCSAALRCAATGTCLDDRDCERDAFCSAARTCAPIGTCVADGDCPEGMVCDTATSACTPGSECGGAELVAEPVHPNLLLVLDRSCSMRREVAGTPKWTSAVEAIGALTMTFDGQMRWGLTLFPDLVTPDCRQDAPAVPIAPGTEMTIQTLLTNALMTSDPNYPDGPCVTNIDTAMEQAAAQPELADPERRSFVMLITDGRQSSGCSAGGGDAGTEMIIGNLAAMGVPTYVVGFGGEVDAAQLSAFAVAGGTARMATPEYYQADDAAMLTAALSDIVGSLVSCDFALDEVPADPSMIFVWFDDSEEVPRDPTHTNGWDYDPATNTVTLYGAPCEELRRGEVMDIDIVFGCGGPVIE